MRKWFEVKFENGGRANLFAEDEADVRKRYSVRGKIISITLLDMKKKKSLY